MEQGLSASTDLFVRDSQKLSYNQIQAVRMLQHSGLETDQLIYRALRENPALEGDEVDLCPVCHYPLGGEYGCQCRLLKRQEDETRPHDEMPIGGQEEWDIGAGTRTSNNFDDDDNDPLARVSGRGEYGAGLSMILHAMVPSAYYPIVEHVIGSLNSHGLLPADIVEDATTALGVSPEKVEYVIRLLQQLDPPGIGARSPREALLLQLQRLRESGDPHPLAELLVRDHFEDLAAKHFREISHRINVTPRVIELELNFISQRLHPFPAHGFDPDLAGVATGASPIQPDVVIRQTARGFDADVVEQRRWNRLCLSETYKLVKQQMKRDTSLTSSSDREHVRRSLDDAANLLNALRQRWHTMQRVTEALIEMQHDYLEFGPSGLKPLTRKQVGDKIGLHESTVSRATDGKFVLLPNGKTVPFDDFFNDSLQAKDAILALVEDEDPRHPFSDEQIAVMLKDKGLEVARRTVAKYREEIGVLPSRLRRNRIIPRHQPARQAVATC